MIEAEFGFLEMQLELVASHAMKLHQPMFGIAPERHDAVGVPGAFDKFVVAVIDSNPKVLVQAQINPVWLWRHRGRFRQECSRHV